jgi:hypothetical protein
MMGLYGSKRGRDDRVGLGSYPPATVAEVDNEVNGFEGFEAVDADSQRQFDPTVAERIYEDIDCPRAA